MSATDSEHGSSPAIDNHRSEAIENTNSSMPAGSTCDDLTEPRRSAIPGMALVDGNVLPEAGDEVKSDCDPADRIDWFRTLLRLSSGGYKPQRVLGGQRFVVKKVETGEMFEFHASISCQEKKHIDVLRSPHPHIQGLIEQIQCENLTGYIRLAPACTLAQHLDSVTPSLVSEGRVRKIARPILDALIHLERLGFVHQNVHPSAVLLFNRPFTAKLGGFERMIKVGDNEDSILLRQTSATSEGLKYIPPELVGCQKPETPANSDLEENCDPATPESASVVGRSRIDLTKVDPHWLGVLLHRIALGRYHDDDCRPGQHLSESMWNSEVVKASNPFRNLVSRLMFASPKDRFSLSDAKLHPWFNAESKSIDLPLVDLETMESDFY